MLLRVCTVTDHRRCLCLVCHFCVLTTFWRHQWSIAEQMHICIIGNLFVHQNILNLHAHKEYHTTFPWLFCKMIFFLSSTTKNANSVSHAWSALNLFKIIIKPSQNCELLGGAKTLNVTLLFVKSTSPPLTTISEKPASCLKLRRELLLTITQTSLKRMNTNQWRAL